MKSLFQNFKVVIVELILIKISKWYKTNYKTIKECDGKLLDINGGERINSIPVKCKAIIASKSVPITSHENMKIEKLIQNLNI